MNYFFRWKDKYEVISGWKSLAQSFCDLCEKLHTDKEIKIYKDLDKWFHKDSCKVRRTKTLIDILSFKYHK